MTSSSTYAAELRELRAGLRSDPDALVWHMTSGNSHCLEIPDFHDPSIKAPLSGPFRNIQNLTGYQLARLLARAPLFNTHELQAFAIVDLETPPVPLRVQQDRESSDVYTDPSTGKRMVVQSFTLDMRYPVPIRVVVDCDCRGRTFGELGFDRERHAIQLFSEKILPMNIRTGTPFPSALWGENPDSEVDEKSSSGGMNSSSEEDSAGRTALLRKKFPGGHTNLLQLALSELAEVGASGKVLSVRNVTDGASSGTGGIEKGLLAIGSSSGDGGGDRAVEVVSDEDEIGSVSTALVVKTGTTGADNSRNSAAQENDGTSDAEIPPEDYDNLREAYKQEAADLVRILAALRDDEDWLTLRNSTLPRAKKLLTNTFPDGSNFVRGDARKKLDQAIARAEEAVACFESASSKDHGEGVYRTWVATQAEKLVRNAILNFAERDEEAIRKVLRAHDEEFYERQYGPAFLVDEIMESVTAVRLQKPEITSVADLDRRYGAVVDEYYTLLSSRPDAPVWPTPFALLPPPQQLSDPKKNKAFYRDASEWVRTLTRRDLLRLAFSRDHQTMAFAHLAVLLFVHQDGRFGGEKDSRCKKLPSYWRESIQRLGVALFATVFPSEFKKKEPVTILSGLPIDLRRDDEQYVVHLFFDGWYWGGKKEAAARVVLLADGYSGGQMQPVHPALGSEKAFAERNEARTPPPTSPNPAGSGGGAVSQQGLSKNQRKRQKKKCPEKSSQVAPAPSSSTLAPPPPPPPMLYFQGLARERVFFVQRLDAYRPWMLAVEQGAFFSYKIESPHSMLEWRRQAQATENFRNRILTKSDEVLARELCDEIFGSGPSGGRKHTVVEGGSFGPAVACSPAVAATTADKSSKKAEVDWFLGLARAKKSVLFGGLHFGARHPHFAHCSSFSTFAIENPAVLAHIKSSLKNDGRLSLGPQKSTNSTAGIVPFLLPPALSEQDFALEGFYWDSLSGSLCDLTPEQLLQVGLLAVEDDDTGLLIEEFATASGDDLFVDDERDKVLAFLRDPKILAEQKRRARQIREEWEAMGNRKPTRKLFPKPGPGEEEDGASGVVQHVQGSDDDRRNRVRESLGKLATQRVKFRRAMQGLNLLRRIGLLQLEGADGGEKNSEKTVPNAGLQLRMQQHGSHLVFHRKGHASVTLVREHGRGRARKELRGGDFVKKMEMLAV